MDGCIGIAIFTMENAPPMMCDRLNAGVRWQDQRVRRWAGCPAGRLAGRPAGRAAGRSAGRPAGRNGGRPTGCSVDRTPGRSSGQTVVGGACVVNGAGKKSI